MKLYNGQVCKTAVRKAPFVLGIVFLSISIFFILASVLTDDSESRIAFLSFGIIFSIPGLVLFIIGVIKIAKNAKKNQQMLDVDCDAWRAERINDPGNPLFRIHCNHCNGLIEYDLRGIDGTRPWFPNGYVVCPNCRAIMRHDATKSCVTQQP